MDLSRSAGRGGVLLAGVIGFSLNSNLALAEPVERDCVVTPSAIVEVSPADSGVIEAVHVERSDAVEKDQLLAQLDSRVESVDHDVAEARSQMDASVNLWQVNLKFDKRKLKRVHAMKHVVSDQEKDKAERDVKQSEWRLQDAKDGLQQRQLELRRARVVLDRREIRSPISGIVVERLRHPGEYVEEHPIVRIARLDPLYVEVIMPMSEFGNVKRGMKAEVIPENQSAKPLPAEVILVDGMGDAASGTFGIRLALPNPKHEIPAGVKCRMRLTDEGNAGGAITMKN